MTNNQLILDNMDLARRMARKKSRFSGVSYDELESAAYFGLVDAASKYDGKSNFSAYASIRISGAMRDQLRDLCWGSRSSPVKAEVYEDQAFYEDEEPCELMGKITSVLPSRAREVVSCYYSGRKIREIAADMDLHESRISQVLSESRSAMQKYWQSREYELWAMSHR